MAPFKFFSAMVGLLVLFSFVYSRCCVSNAVLKDKAEGSPSSGHRRHDADPLDGVLDSVWVSKAEGTQQRLLNLW